MTKKPPSTTGMSKLYPREYVSWRNAKQRCRENGWTLADEFNSFSGFLAVVGPKPTPEHTLDRIDPSLFEYSPSNCRWATKVEQANNRRNSIRIMFAEKLTPIAQVARATNQNPDTLRRRHARNYSDREVVFGRQTRMARPLRGELSEQEIVPHRWEWMAPGDKHSQKLWERFEFLYRGRIPDPNNPPYCWPYANEDTYDFVTRTVAALRDARSRNDFSYFVRPEVVRYLDDRFAAGWEDFEEIATAWETKAFYSMCERTFKTDTMVSVGRSSKHNHPVYFCEIPWRGDKTGFEMYRHLLAFQKSKMQPPQPLIDALAANEDLLVKANFRRLYPERITLERRQGIDANG